ncbi:hypothetical protein KM1_173130 [Entamoeba histolytica HM-3:IMSS]|uniref:Uncharacterized protein n=2 Tax=Entamoeba TaxID=5758 RepID=M7WFM3_ENTHI|nr:hypothetical protein KM1_173130 [Entamoeba histolytica HM-3:IMSS]
MEYTPEDIAFFELLKDPVKNEAQIIEILARRFYEIQTKQHKVYTLSIAKEGSAFPIQLTNDGYLILRIPITRPK